MKHFKFPGRRLDSRGVSHLLLPLLLVVGVAVVGTFMLVTSHANPSDATAAVAKKSPSVGYIMLYNANDATNLHKTVKVTASGSVKCAGVKPTGVVSLRTDLLPHSLRCQITSSGNEKYNIAYDSISNPGTYNQSFAVDVDKNMCTEVFPDQSKTAKVAIKNNKCPAEVREAVKISPNFRVLPNDFKKGTKRITGFADMYASGVGFGKNVCTGSVNIAVTDKSTGQVVSQHSYPVRYVPGNAASAQKYHGGQSYCVATFNNLATGKLTATKTYVLQADFSGSSWLNPVSASAETKPVVVAAKKPATTPTTHTVQGSAQPAVH
jgi:uncharacterized FlaG/YvyC family protein